MATSIAKTKSVRFKTLFAPTAFLICLLSLMGDGFTATTSKGALDENVRENIKSSYWQLPLRFEANQGQTDSRVKFVSRGLGYNVFLTSAEAVFSLRSSKTYKERANSKRYSKTQDRTAATVFSIQLMGVNPSIKLRGLEKLPIKTNYLIGNDPRTWRQEIPTYAKVEFKELYAGIDLIYYGNQRRLEFDFLVHPSANHKSIRMKFKNVNHLKLDRDGNLILGIAGGNILLEKPLIYQQVDGKKRTVSGHYKLQAKNIVGFAIASYDTKIPLVIDPVLNYSTYLGGNRDDFGNGITVDTFGNAYIIGSTSSIDFPTENPFQSSRGGLNDVFISKFNPDGSVLVYSTYLGGSGEDRGNDIAVDNSGNAYITGSTQSTNFPTTTGAFQENQRSFQDAFVTKLDSDGSDLIYSTYLGGLLNDDSGNGIAVDSSGNAYVTGFTQSASFPTTTGAFQENQRSFQDAFVTKLNPDSTLPDPNDALIYSTYLGGNSDDFGNGIAVDSSGNAYVTGFTQSASFPTTTGAFQENQRSFQDAFVTKLNPDSTLPDPNDALIYSTYLGGNSDDFGNGIAVDSAGKCYIVGATRSADFPTQDPLQSTLISLQDAFVTKLNPDSTLPDPDDALIYSTYLGGNDIDLGNDIAVDTSSNAYITGTTQSNDFPTEDAFQSARNSLRDAFIAKINPSGEAILYSTYIGGVSDDLSNSIVIDTRGNAYIVGTTASVNFPTTTGVFEEDQQGAQDAFVSKLDPFGDTFIYSTYLGGSGDDFGNGIAVDSSGNAYVTGTTQSGDFPTANAYDNSLGGAQDAFVTKLNSTGSAPLVYSTYLGGSGDDSGNGIAVDSFGNANVTGTTQSGDFPTANAYDNSLGGAQDAFMAKFDPSLSGVASLIYSTYLGGANNDSGNSIAVDSSDNAYVTGTTQSGDFPTANAYDNSLGGAQDAFMAKFDLSLSGVASLIYSTYLGGANDDLGNSITVDSSGNAYVAGTTQSDDYPVKNPLQSTRSGGNDTFVTKFNSAGSALTYSTYLGGSMDDFGYSVAVDIFGNAYVTGTTESDDFPTKDAFEANRAGLKDAFITKVNSAGNKLVYSSYLGGVDDDLGNHVALDGLGNAFVTGSTLSGDFPTKSVQNNPGGFNDGFVTKIQEAEGSDSTTSGTEGSGGGCFISSTDYGSPVCVQTQLAQAVAMILVFFISIMILSVALLYLLRRLRLPVLVFQVSQVKRRFSHGMPILRKS